jgi:hypothetical protein
MLVNPLQYFILIDLIMIISVHCGIMLLGNMVVGFVSLAFDAIMDPFILLCFSFKRHNSYIIIKF